MTSRFHAPLRPSRRLQSVGPRHLRGRARARGGARAAAVDGAAHCAAALLGGEGLVESHENGEFVGVDQESRLKRIEWDFISTNGD